MQSPNQIVIDQINNEDILLFHAAIDDIRSKLKVRVRIKKDGRTSSPLTELPLLKDCGYEIA